MLVAWPLSMVGQGAGGSVPKKKGKPLRLAVDLNWRFGVHGIEFFQEYKRLVGGPSSTFDVPLGFWASIGSYQFENIAIGITGGYNRAVVRENYTYRPFGSDTMRRVTQGLSQNMALTAVPVMLSLDYLPIDRQFSTYIGAAAGIAVTSFSWTESAAESQDPRARTGGVRFDDSRVTPAGMVRAGVVLGWDKEVKTRTSAGLYLEVSYLWAPFTAPVLQAVQQSVPGITRTSGITTIQAGGIGIHAGVNITLQ
jgi:hypothetical protein